MPPSHPELTQESNAWSFAWTFDPTSFHRWLLENTVSDHSLDVVKLEKLARAIVDAAEGDGRGYLVAIGCDPADREAVQSYFEVAPGVDHRPDWYAISMANHVRAARSIKHPGIVREVLEAVGQPGLAEQIVNGVPLSALVEASGEPELVQAFRYSRAGSWLPVTEAEFLSRSLVRWRQAFEDPPSAVISRYSKSGVSPDRLHRLTSGALEDANAMLNAAVERQQPLRLYVDLTA